MTTQIWYTYINILVTGGSNPRGCGQSAYSTTRVKNGDDAQPGQWPWQVLILISYPSTTKSCGGTIISEHNVISAAHCL